MGLDRNAPARIDRRLLAELDGDGGVQMVKVPVSDAVWSVWRRLLRRRGGDHWGGSGRAHRS